MNNYLRKILSFILIAPAVLPLVYVDGIVYPYVAAKTFLFLVLGIIGIAIFIFLAFSGSQFFYRRLHSPFSWIPFLLLIVAYVTSFFGINFYHSFWGLFERGDGLLTLSIITSFFYLVILSADSVFLKHLAKTITIVAGIVAAIAVLQWFSIVLGGRIGFLPPVTGRIGSTFGNAAFLSGYLGIALFVVLAILRDSDKIWSWICKTSALLSILAIILSATRGTILALVFAGAVALVFASLKEKGKIKQMARYGLVAFIVFCGLFFIFRTNLAQSSFEPIRRVASISLSDGTVSSRLFIWSRVTEQAMQRPILGYGAEHITQLFDKIYDPSKIVEQWFDRSHNSFLDYFAQFGFFGLFLYIAIIVSFTILAFRLYRREEPYVMNYGFLFLLLILTYSIQNFFVFDTPSSLWLLFILFALLLVWNSEYQMSSLTSGIATRIISIIVPICFLFVSIPTVIMPLYANILLTKGYSYHLLDVKKTNEYFERGLALGTYADLEYGYQAYDMYTARQATFLTGQDRVAAYEYALSLLTANFEKYPYDSRTATYLGHVIDTAPSGVVIDDEFDRHVLLKAIELSPLRAQAWYMMANISLRKADALPQGDLNKEKYFRQAINVLEEYAQKEPTLPVPRYILATLYYKLGDKITAKKWADEALPLYKTPDVAAAGPAVKYYLALGDWQHAVYFLNDLVKDNPSDYDTLYDLAKVTYLSGDPATAEKIVSELRKKNPSILETDQNFLKVITTYEQSQK